MADLKYLYINKTSKVRDACPQLKTIDQEDPRFKLRKKRYNQVNIKKVIMGGSLMV